MIETLIRNEEAELTQSGKQSIPVFLSTRIRLARNILGHTFPERASADERRELLSLASARLAEVDALQGASVFEVEALTELERRVLLERHLVSRELCEHGEQSAVVISPDQSVAVMINEEDHLRVQVLRSGFNLRTVWNQIDKVDLTLESKVDFAFSDEFGYLTACPTNLGTAMRASVMMHLPGLAIADQMEKVIRAVNQLGLTVRGLFGEGSDATGHIFQISNQQTLGESEKEILQRLDRVIRTIRDHELNARFKLLEDAPIKLFDQIGRAHGILSNSYIISSNEAMNMLSLMRLAVDFGFLPEEHRATIDRLFIECQPGHIQYFAGQDYEPDQRDHVRAEKLRTEAAQLSPLSFDKRRQPE